MKIVKNIIRCRMSRIWLIVSVVMIALLIALECVAAYWGNVLDVAFGGMRAVEVDTGGEKTVYYEKETSSKEEANERAFAITREIESDGAILLANHGETLPLKEGERKVSVFGKNSVNLVYGGSGSGGGDTTFAKSTLYEGLEQAGFECNPVLRSFYENESLSGPGRGSNPGIESGGASYLNTGETPYSKYTDAVKESYDEYSDAAIVVISRIGGEGFDLPMMEVAETQDHAGTKHYLALDTYEQELLRNVRRQFDKVIVLLNTLNIVEAGFVEEFGVDACLWIGGPGTRGTLAVGDILSGAVNPSGHTTDTWSADFTLDPTWNNFSNRNHAMADFDGNSADTDRYYNSDTERNVFYYYVNYEESVYVGYRYYETRAAQEYMNSGDDSWYEENVVYPFGYGLSYTSFDWQVTDKSGVENVSFSQDGQCSVTVRVTNTGDVAGKDVVQLYAALPYENGGLEKPYEVLCGYAKTPLLYPEGEANGADKPNFAEVTITFDLYDIASYDYQGKSGFKGYVLEAGDYQLFVSQDAHNVCEAIPFKVATDITWERDPVTDNKVVNRFTDCEDPAFNSDTAIADSLMSRADLSKLPDAPKEEDRYIDNEMLAALQDLTPNNPEEAGWTEMPEQGKSGTLDLVSLVQQDEESGEYFVDYNDERWDELLDQITVEEMLNMFNNGGFKTMNIASINKPATLESDGPVGWCNFMSMTDTSWKGNNAYTSQVVMSATWNTELIERMGECVGEEGLWGAVSTDGRSYSGWYSPGVNIHRSPFGGRNFEYFSEDPFLTGTIAAAEVRGCQSKGVYCYVKHFALNEQETHRGGGSSWVTEQAMREIYLKPFEIVVKEGGTRAMMSSFNRIGTRWTGGDYRLLTEILRNEWGFCGTVITDYNQSNMYMSPEQMIKAGGDLNLCTDRASYWGGANFGSQPFDADSAADVTALRNATKNVLYTVANSNAMNALNYKYLMAIWRILVFIVLNIVAGAAIAVWGVFAIRKALKQAKTMPTSSEEV